MAKSPDAFRTISEVADWLGVEAHVLRFWESKFTQVKPVKRAGGRRYYRPADMALLAGIRQLLHEDGLTIRGVQKILREKGAGHVSALSPELRLDGDAPADRPGAAKASGRQAAEPPAAHAPERPERQDAPPLPFDLPDAHNPATEHHSAANPLPETDLATHPATAEPDAGADSARPAAGIAQQEVLPTDAAGDEMTPGAPVPSGVLRRSRARRLDPDAVAPILERARRLAQRLKDIPE